MAAQRAQQLCSASHLKWCAILWCRLDLSAQFGSGLQGNLPNNLALPDALEFFSIENNALSGTGRSWEVSEASSTLTLIVQLPDSSMGFVLAGSEDAHAARLARSVTSSRPITVPSTLPLCCAPGPPGSIPWIGAAMPPNLQTLDLSNNQLRWKGVLIAGPSLRCSNPHPPASGPGPYRHC